MVEMESEWGSDCVTLEISCSFVCKTSNGNIWIVIDSFCVFSYIKTETIFSKKEKVVAP